MEANSLWLNESGMSSSQPSEASKMEVHVKITITDNLGRLISTVEKTQRINVSDGNYSIEEMLRQGTLLRRD